MILFSGDKALLLIPSEQAANLKPLLCVELIILNKDELLEVSLFHTNSFIIAGPIPLFSKAIYIRLSVASVKTFKIGITLIILCLFCKKYPQPANSILATAITVVPTVVTK